MAKGAVRSRPPLQRIKATCETAEKSLQNEKGDRAAAEARVTATLKELERLEALLSERAGTLATFKQQEAEAKAATEEAERVREQLTTLEQQLRKLGSELRGPRRLRRWRLPKTEAERRVGHDRAGSGSPQATQGPD